MGAWAASYHLKLPPGCHAMVELEKQGERGVAWNPRNLVSDGTLGGGVCRTPRRECLFGPCHPTISRCWLRRANTLSLQLAKRKTHYFFRSSVPLVLGGPPHTVGKFPGVRARPSSPSLISQSADARSVPIVGLLTFGPTYYQ
jgi:hypothetical protein